MKLNLTLSGLLIIGILAGCGAEQEPMQGAHAPAVQSRDVSSPAVPVRPTLVAPPSSRTFSWKTPDGWEQKSPKPLRLVSFQVGPEAAGAECGVSVLKGMAGGVEMNVNRWRRQMGQEPLTPEAVAALPVIEVAGGAGPLVEVAQSQAEGAGVFVLLGTLCARDGYGVFVKMVGPQQTVVAERERFLEFCRSIR